MTKNNALTTVSVSSIMILISSCTFAAPIAIPEAPQIAAKGYVLMDYHSGKVIADKNMQERLSPASLTKMMTSYVIGQEIARGNISENDDVAISKNAWAKNFPDSSKMFIEVGTTVKLGDLNRGIVIQSGNDATVAMAEHIAGSENAFVDLMNAWANTLGMNDTHFANVHGLDNENLYSTPYDMALLGQALIRDVPNEYSLYAEKTFTYNNITQNNRNALLWDKSMNVDGIKTGYTSNAGYSLVSSATEGNMRLVAVVMGTKDENSRKSESKKLLSYGFRFFETIETHKANQAFAQERVWLGNKDTIELGTQQDIYVTLYRGQAKNLNASYVLNEQLEAPITKGDVVGTIYYHIDDDNVAQYPLLALETIEEGNFFSRILDKIILFFTRFF